MLLLDLMFMEFMAHVGSCFSHKTSESAIKTIAPTFYGSFLDTSI